MSSCIYCKAGTKGDRSRAHVFPEALGNEKVLLPPGTICDPCNNYAGHELESALVAHPAVAMALHYCDVPGKKGRIRKSLGSVTRKPSELGTVSITFGLANPKFIFHADGAVEIEASAATPKGFKHDRFRRALHYLGLNAVARVEGPDAVRDAQYDRVRSYVRSPKIGAIWSYAEHTPSIRDIPRQLRFGFPTTTHGKLVALQLYQTVFVVDLLDAGVLRPFAEAQGASFVGAESEALPPVVIKVTQRPEPPAA